MLLAFQNKIINLYKQHYQYYKKYISSFLHKTLPTKKYPNKFLNDIESLTFVLRIEHNQHIIQL